MLTNENIVKIGDLGVAKDLNKTLGRTKEGTTVYMSPEQSRGREFEDQAYYLTHKTNTDIWFEFNYKMVNFNILNLCLN